MTLSALNRSLALIAALSLPMAAMAQQQVPSAWDDEVNGEANEIIVTGNQQQVQVTEVQRQVRDIVVRQGSMFDEPLARFEDRLCPGVVGLTAEMAFAFNARLRANAEELGIRLLDDDCDPNFIVVFADDGEAMFRNMMRDEPQRFQYLNSGEQSDILEPGPVHVWTNVQPRTLTGMPIAQVRNLFAPPQVNANAAHTRIYTTTRNDIVTVMLSFDRSAVNGLSIRQLADYATMRGLAQTRPPADPVMDSILTLFDAEAPPLGLTEFDRAYLRSLYDGMPNLPGFRRVGGTTRQLRLMAEESAGASVTDE